MVLTGEPNAGVQSAVRLNSVEYAIVGAVRTVTRDVTREDTYRLNAWSGGVGARNAQRAGWPRPNMVYDATADTSKPGGITPPLLIQTATQAASGTATQTQAIFAIAEIGGVLNAFSHGQNAGPTNKLLRWEWDGATTTWTRDDLLANTYAAGVAIPAISKNVAYISGNLVVGYQATRAGHAYTTVGTPANQWSAHEDTALATSTNWLSNFGVSATGYALLGNRGLYSFTLGADFALVLASVYPSTETVKTFFSWKNSSASDVLYLLTNKALRQSNTTPNAFSILLNMPGGDAHCALPLGAFMYLSYGKKGAIREYQWDANGGLVSIEGGLDLADGLPSDMLKLDQGVYDLVETEGYLYAAMSNNDSQSRTAVYRRRWPFTTGDGWHAVAKILSSYQAIYHIAVSSADDKVLGTTLANISVKLAPRVNE